MRASRRMPCLCLAAVVTAAPGCGGGGEPDEDPVLAGAGDDDAAPDDDTTGPPDDDAADDDGPVSALSATPSPLLLGVGDVRGLALTADGAPVDPAQATWTSDDPDVATVDAGAVRGVALGATTLHASYGGATAEIPAEVARLEARGIWVTRWTVAGTGGASGVGALIDAIADAGFNQVFFQVRGTFDALYGSSLEPWSSTLDGLGVDPGWDPLAAAVERAHARGIELHAYINSFPFWSGTSPPAHTTPEHRYNVNPEWLVADEDGEPMALNSSYVFASPGNPAVRDWVASVAEDIAIAYDVDGVHLDYIRYPGTQYSHDAASEAAFDDARASDPSLTWTQFQRDNVTATVGAVSERVWAIRPSLKVTCSVWGVYHNAWGWSSVSQGLDDYAQDSGAFLEDGVADAIVPMMYWPLTDPEGQRLDWKTLAVDHQSRAAAAGRQVYGGYCVASDTCPDNDIGEIVAEIEVGREIGLAGTSAFDYSLLAGNGWLDDLGAGPFAEPARVPPMPWKGE